jgi:putative membrane protein
MLMLVQVLGMGCFAFLPALRRLGMALLPRRILRHHAARRAAEEFLFLSRHVPPERPLVLMYVSLAERYAHILHSRAASAKVPGGTWDDIVDHFTAGVKKPGLGPSLESAVAKIADALESHFPDRGEPNLLRDDVR